jgi:flagellar protein FlaG
MSIPTVSMNAGDGLQHSQKTTPPAAGNSLQRTTTATATARAASVPEPVSNTPAAKAAADVKDGEAKQVQQSLQEINQVLAGLSISVRFQIDPNYKDVIIKVVDQQTDKVILQIPTMEVVRISKAMDSLKGLLFSQAV